MRCPDGHKWWACAHEEIAHPVLGSILMCVGLFHLFLGVYFLVAR